MKKTIAFLALLLSTAVSAVAAPAQPKLNVNAFPIRMSAELAAAFRDAAAEYGLDPNFLAATAFKESAFNPRAVSRIGAEGIMQLKPKTARALGVENSFDARQNVFGGAKYLRELLDRFGGDVEKALAAYNLGPKRIDAEGPRATPGVIEYVTHIRSYYSAATRTLS